MDYAGSGGKTLRPEGVSVHACVYACVCVSMMGVRSVDGYVCVCFLRSGVSYVPGTNLAFGLLAHDDGAGPAVAQPPLVLRSRHKREIAQQQELCGARDGHKHHKRRAVSALSVQSAQDLLPAHSQGQTPDGQ